MSLKNHSNAKTGKIRPAFPQHLEALRAIMKKVLGTLQDGADERHYSFVWLEESRGMSVISARVENIASSVDRGMVLRILKGKKNFEAATNRLDEQHLLKLASNLRSEADAYHPAEGNPPAYRPTTLTEEIEAGLPEEIVVQIPSGADHSTPVHFSPICETDPYRTEITDMRKRAVEYREKITELSERFPERKEDEHLADVRVSVRLSIRTQIFMDRSRNISQTLPVSLFYGMGISTQGHFGRTIRGGLGSLEIALPDEENLKDSAFTPFMLGRAERIKPGRYRVITGPDVTGVIAHEAFGHTQEGDTCMKGRSIAPPLRDSNVKVGNDEATIINFAGIYSMEGASFGTNGSYYFDHEGQLARPQAILNKGYLSTPMTDLLAARILKAPRTANGKRESWKRPLMTRQTNTYFTPGDKTLDELIEMAGNGYLAQHAHGGMEDPKGGSLTAGTEYLQEIKDGKLTGKIFLGPSGGHVELSDPVFTLLGSILGKSRVNHPDQIPVNKYGGCGKYHKESVDAGSGGPYILWESINCG